MSKGMGFFVAGSTPIHFAMASYRSSCGYTPAAGCRLSAVRNPCECNQLIKPGGSGKSSRFHVYPVQPNDLLPVFVICQSISTMQTESGISCARNSSMSDCNSFCVYAQ